MFTKADILARLQDGDSMDEIAKEMSDVLNAAQADYESAKQADAEANRVMEAKRAAVNDMLDAVCDYLVAAGEDDFIDDLKEIETDKVIEMLDGSIKMAKSLEKLKELQFPLGELHKAATINPRVHKIVVDEDNADQVIGDFLKKLGL